MLLSTCSIERFAFFAVIRFEIKRAVLSQKLDDIRCRDTTLNTQCWLRQFQLPSCYCC